MRLLEKKEVVHWCFEGVTKVTLAHTKRKELLQEAQEKEREWARSVIGGRGSQWTTDLCERLVQESLILLGRENVRRTEKRKSTIRNKRYSPDLECDKYVYEVKGRNWTTTGTAGEKILGVPMKYGEVPRVYSKPLQIILVGYQEYEARKEFAFGDLLNSHEQTEELQESLAFYKEHDIEYIGFTDILKCLKLGENYWDKM